MYCVGLEFVVTVLSFGFRHYSNGIYWVFWLLLGHFVAGFKTTDWIAEVGRTPMKPSDPVSQHTILIKQGHVCTDVYYLARLWS